MERPPLVVLPGGLGVADGGGEALQMLAQGRRLVRIDYAAAADYEALCENVLAEGAAEFDLIGFSIGGWFAQCIAARAPGRVRRIVLAHSFVLEPKLQWRFTAALKLWPLLPSSLVRAGVMRRARLALEPLRRARPQLHGQIERTVAETLDRPATMDSLIAQQRIVRDSLADAPCPVTAPMLIIESSTDALVGAPARAELRRRFPQAEHVDFPDGGHVSALAAPEAFAQAVDRFLRD